MGSNTVITLLSILPSCSTDLKKAIFKWLCVTYPYCSKSAKQTYVKLYSCVFYHLSNEEILPYVCHLLYAITTRQVLSFSFSHVDGEAPPCAPSPLSLSTQFAFGTNGASTLLAHPVVRPIRFIDASSATTKEFSRIHAVCSCRRRLEPTHPTST